MSSSPTKYLIASGNKNKVKAIHRILGGYGIELCDLSDFPPIPEPVEDGETFLDNALIKSRYYGQKTGLPAIADDSGLEIDALGGEPGVHSARYAGADTPHSVKMDKVLELMKGLPEQKRRARFRCVAAITYPDGREVHADGTMEGQISTEKLGDGGFGYDPIFFIPELQKTAAQLSPDEKDELSHRGVAFRRLANSHFES